MDHRNKSKTIGMIGIFACVIGFSGAAIATPPEDVPFWADILNRLNSLHERMDHLSTAVEQRDVAQFWDKKLPADDNGDPCHTSRFICIWPDAVHSNGTAVRDNETGLVWERSTDAQTHDWFSAIGHCANLEVGGRKGWQLPMREQLASLVDSSNDNPTLPSGHPFLNVQSSDYWSASTNATNPAVAWDVRFGSGMVGTSNKAFKLLAWCVRGGQSFDGQEVPKIEEPAP